jgi:hypothetical protein
MAVRLMAQHGAALFEGVEVGRWARWVKAMQATFGIAALYG